MTYKLNRAKEYHEQYAKDFEIFAKFLREEGGIFGCKKEWLKPPEMDDEHHSYTLSLPHFKFIADYLAKQSTFSCPAHIINTLDKGIKLRIECNRIYEEQKPECVATNESHRHAIRLFQEIRQTLFSKLESRSSGSSAKLKSLTGEQ